MVPKMAALYSIGHKRSICQRLLIAELIQDGFLQVVHGLYYKQGREACKNNFL
jgi:hypothetical protein